MMLSPPACASTVHGRVTAQCQESLAWRNTDSSQCRTAKKTRKLPLLDEFCSQVQARRLLRRATMWMIAGSPIHLRD